MAPLLRYMRERLPPDPLSGERITGNPLMLSMVASIADLRQGIEMPTTIAELYEVATRAMLARSSGAAGCAVCGEWTSAVIASAAMTPAAKLRNWDMVRTSR